MELTLRLKPERLVTDDVTGSSMRGAEAADRRASRDGGGGRGGGSWLASPSPPSLPPASMPSSSTSISLDSLLAHSIVTLFGVRGVGGCDRLFCRLMQLILRSALLLMVRLLAVTVATAAAEEEKALGGEIRGVRESVRVRLSRPP